MPSVHTTRLAPIAPSSIFDDDDDDDGWQDMPVIRNVDPNLALDEEDQKRYHYVAPAKKLSTDASNATGNLIDLDDFGSGWREKVESNEDDYTRLKLNDDEDADDAYLRTRYLFDEDKAMTPLSQMQATKNLLTEAQRIAYVGLCSLVARKMTSTLQQAHRKELAPAIHGMELWRLKIMGRIFYHMELETDEQKMIESLHQHGVDPNDLVSSLMTTHTVANPEYDPAEARRKEVEEESERQSDRIPESQNNEVPSTPTSPNKPQLPRNILAPQSLLHPGQSVYDQTTANVLQPHEGTSLPGVSTTLSSTDKHVTLDIRWTVLCDLFLILIADSVYDARSRMLLETVAAKLGLGWIDVVRFEKRVTDALEIQEGAEQLGQREVIEGRGKAARNRRYVMMGLATIGGGLVIGLSAGLLAPVIGAGLGAALATVGVSGTAGFLGGVGGAAVITTGGVLTGSSIAAKGMARRTRQVRTFDLLPLHNNKRVSCIITVPGFMASQRDDVRLPFSVLDSVVGDVFSVLWEPEMMGEMGNALRILTSEVLSQVGQTVLQATVMTALMSALQWPIVLTKLGYLIDNPWSNALDRARAAGLVLADVLLNRSLGVRPITLIGFSLGARVIFYALLELAKNKAFGIVQDVFLLGATVTATTKSWLEVRSVIAGRFVNAFARSDWVLNYLFRATTGGGTVAGLRPIDGIPGLENVDVTDKIAGHTSYRTYMPIILDQLGFPVSATYFNEPEDPDFEQERVVIREEEALAAAKKKKGFSIFRSLSKTSASKEFSSPSPIAPPPSSSRTPQLQKVNDDEFPERLEHRPSPPRSSSATIPSSRSSSRSEDPLPAIPAKAGFDFQAIGKVLGKENLNADESQFPIASPTPHNAPSSNVVANLEVSEAKSPTPIHNDLSSTPRATLSILPSANDDPQQTSWHPPDVPSLSASFSRSLSMNDASSFHEESIPSSSSLPGSMSSSTSTPTHTPNWPPPSSLFSFASNDASIWAPDKSYSSFPRYEPTPPPPPLPLPLPQRHDPYSSFASSTVSFETPDNLTYQEPQPRLAFGSIDGSVSAYDTSPAKTERDPWAPIPLGLQAAIAKKSSYTLNPWET